MKNFLEVNRVETRKSAWISVGFENLRESAIGF